MGAIIKITENEKKGILLPIHYLGIGNGTLVGCIKLSKLVGSSFEYVILLALVFDARILSGTRLV